MRKRGRNWKWKSDSSSISPNSYCSKWTTYEKVLSPVSNMGNVSSLKKGPITSVGDNAQHKFLCLETGIISGVRKKHLLWPGWPSGAPARRAAGQWACGGLFPADQGALPPAPAKPHRDAGSRRRSTCKSPRAGATPVPIRLGSVHKSCTRPLKCTHGSVCLKRQHREE